MLTFSKDSYFTNNCIMVYVSIHINLCTFIGCAGYHCTGRFCCSTGAVVGGEGVHSEATVMYSRTVCYCHNWFTDIQCYCERGQYADCGLNLPLHILCQWNSLCLVSGPHNYNNI